MNLNTLDNIRDAVKVVGSVGICAVPILLVAYIGMQTLSGVEAGPPVTSINAELEPTMEDRTRAILFEDLNEAWEHYETGDYSEAMWTGVYKHVTRKWNEQAKDKGWSEIGWAPPKKDVPTQVWSKASDAR